MSNPLGPYVNHMMRLWAEICKLPVEEQNERLAAMGFGDKVVTEFLLSKIEFSDEPIEYCQPSPEGWAKMVKIFDEEEKKNE